MHCVFISGLLFDAACFVATCHLIPPSYQVIIPPWLTGGQAFEELVPAEEIDELEGWSAGSVEEAMQVHKNYN